MGILSLALQISMLPVVVDGPDLLSPITFVAKSGVGEACKKADLVTIEYRIEDETGKKIADSERRGLPTTLEIGGLNGDALLAAAANGARADEERWVVLIAGDWYPQNEFSSLVRSSGPLLIRLKVVRIERR